MTQSVGRNRPENYRTIELEDVDRAIFKWFDETVDAHVTGPQGERVKVPVSFASSERWVSSKERKGLRDKDGRMILPLIGIRRRSVDPNNSMLALGSNVPRLQLSRRVSNATSPRKNLREERPVSQRGQDGAIYDIYTIPFPFNGLAIYELIIQTQKHSHMNAILQKIMSSLEFYDVPCFVAPIAGDNRKDSLPTQTTEFVAREDSPFESRPTIDGYYVVGYLDNEVSDSGNLDEFTDEERIIRFDSSFRVPVYLQMDPEGTREPVQVERTAFAVKFKEETVGFVDDPYELELLFSTGDLSIIERNRRK